MKNGKMLMNRIVLSMSLILIAAICGAQEWRSGWLSDSKDSVDSETGAKVVMVANMMQSEDETGKSTWRIRYVGIEVPRPGLKPDSIRVYDKAGKLIKHEHPEAHEYSLDYKSGGKGTFLKLFLERKAGFDFRVEVDG